MHYDVSWHDDAKCIDTDPEYFFPGDGEQGAEKTVEVKAFCQNCPVKMKCLEL